MSDTLFSYRAEPVPDQDQVDDVRLVWPDRTWHLLGRGGTKREQALLRPLEETTRGLPVLIGSGLGIALEQLLNSGAVSGVESVAVVDRETPIQEVTKARERFGHRPEVLWLDDPDPESVLKELTQWQTRQGGAPLIPLANPVYLRLAPDYYALILQHLKASAHFDFWAKARYPRFTAKPPRILLITSRYFLMGELIAACKRLGVPHYLLQIDEDETGHKEFVEELLKAVLEFKPDFAFTINHLGVDREGVLIDLLERLELPLASWFVDNPHLILYLYNKLNSDYTAIFTWDTDNIASLKERGFPHVEYLPLGVDVRRFHSGALPQSPSPPQARVAFVGSSMLYKIGHRLKAGKFPKKLLLRYREVAHEFRHHDERSVRVFLSKRFPELMAAFEGLDSVERQLAFEVTVVREATRQYRKECLLEILPFDPLIAGDKGWKITFRHEDASWKWHPELNYYDDLPGFYPLHEINFNCTSAQMKGAVNQRVFDVPATGSFLLTDHRAQMENLFEPEKEVIFFNEPGEIPDLVRYYLDHPQARNKVVQAAGKRILAEHTYEHRLTTLMETMRRLFG
jgi:spore maturation protein CgeB